jgi:hypothetical protein
MRGIGIWTIGVALTISVISAYYSVLGLVAIFAASIIPIAIMGTALEVGKITTAVWLHLHWERANVLMKTYLTFALVLLMFITSMGIFGFLSKAHVEQNSNLDIQLSTLTEVDNSILRLDVEIANMESRVTTMSSGDISFSRVDNLISRETLELNRLRDTISSEKSEVRLRIQKEIDQLNKKLLSDIESADKQIIAINIQMKNCWNCEAEEKQLDDLTLRKSIREEETSSMKEKLSKSLASELSTIDTTYSAEMLAVKDRLRDLKSQSTDRTSLIDDQILTLETKIVQKRSQLLEKNIERRLIDTKYKMLEAEVGPIKYIAEMVYGNEASSNRELLGSAVRWVIIILVLVFDPLAIVLVIAGLTILNRSDDDDATPVEIIATVLEEPILHTEQETPEQVVSDKKEDIINTRLTPEQKELNTQHKNDEER